MQVEDFRDYIRSLPISQVISRYISLNKRGQNHEAICPFHDDTNPSLKVNDSKGIYKCFVCQESGDSIKFVSNFRNKNFIETLKELSELFNIDLELNEKKRSNPKYELAKRVLDAADQIYFSYPRKTKHHELLKFLKNRGLDQNIAEQFRIGFINDQNILTQFLEKKQKENPKEKIIDIALEIGIIKKGKKGGLYDTFRNRITFPIWDQRSQVVGFGSRAITDRQMPKYLNSGESLIFKKSFLLYGSNLAKNNVHDSKNIILTEGYMDTIALHQFNFKNAVAIMGIALSDAKAKQISNLASEIYLCLDNDQAGFLASKRVNQTLLHNGKIAKIIDLSPHKDPDEFLIKEGRIEFQKRFDNAKAFIDQLIEIETSKNFGANTDLKINALNKVYEIVSKLGDDLRAHERVINASKYLGLSSDPETIIQNYKEFLKGLKNNSFKPKAIAKQDTATVNQEVNYPEFEGAKERDAQLAQTPCKIDTWILRSLFQFPVIYQETGFTEILDFVKNNETKNFVFDWGKQEIQEISEEKLSKILFKVFDEPNRYSKVFENFVYSMTFSFAKTDESKLSQYLKELRTKVKMEFLIREKNSLKETRSKTIKEEDLMIIDQKIMDLNKEISNIKIQNHKF